MAFDTRLAITSIMLENPAFVEFKPSQLTIAADRVVAYLESLDKPEFPDQDSEVAWYADQINKCLKEDECLPMTDVIEDISAALATQLQTAFDSITEEIGEEVESLADEIRAKKDEILIKLGYDSLSETEVHEDETDLEEETWEEQTDEAAVEHINAQLSAIGVREKVQEFSQMSLTGLLERAARIQGTPVVLDKMSTTALVDFIHKKSQMFRSDVVTTLAWLTNPEKNFIEFVQNVSSLPLKKTTSRVNKIIALANENMARVMSAIAENESELPASSDFISDIRNNFRLLNRNMSILTTVSYVLRNITYKNKLLLSKTQYNPDALKGFVEAGYKKCDLDAIARYIDAVPDKGMALEDAISLMPKIKAYSAQMNERAKANREMLMQSSYRRAAAEVLEAHFASTNASDVQDKNYRHKKIIHENKITDIKEKYNPQNGALEDYLYEYLLDTYHSSSLVRDLHKKMRVKYTKVATENINPTEAGLTLATVEAIAEIVAEFIKKNFVK